MPASDADGAGRPAALTLAAIAGALAWSLLLVLPHLRGEASVLDRIEAPLTDLRFLVTGPRPAPDDVVVVAIDDETVRLAGRYPLPRAFVAKLLGRLAQARPRAIGLDMLFVDAGPGDADAELAAALAASGAAIGMAATFPRDGSERRADYGPFSGLPVAERLLRPIERLRAAPSGVVNVATDHGGMARHVPLLVAAEGGVHPALALRVASLAAGRPPEIARDSVRVGDAVVPVDAGASLALRYYGPQGRIRTVSAGAAMEGAADDALKGRILLVGATMPGSGDTLSTPFDRVLPGVELMATAIANLTHGDALVRTTTIRRVDSGLALALPVLVILLLSASRVGVGLALAGLLLAVLATVETVLFSRGIWLSLALPLAATAVPLGPYLAARLWLDRRRELRLTQERASLLRFHPPAVAARLRSQPDFLEVPVEQRASVLFVDLSGFTGLSEGLGAVATQALLKEMHDLVENAATLRGGSVTSFMGDGAMVLFGLPEAQADDPDRALATALALARDLRAWLSRRVGGPGERTGVRIGVHSGPVVVSRLGGARNQHITATGDTVNVTSRLLDIAKTERAELVTTAALLADLHGKSPLPGPVAFKRVAVRGRVETLDVHCIA